MEKQAVVEEVIQTSTEFPSPSLITTTDALIKEASDHIFDDNSLHQTNQQMMTLDIPHAKV